SDKIKQFGEPYLALASYNAGERPVKRWMMERPGLAREEFIDDIPYPQTQNYVKKILGTAEDYRRLYGSGQAQNDNATQTVPVTATASTATAPATTRAIRETPRKPKAKN